MTEELPTPKRRQRLSAQDRWTIFQEAAAKDSPRWARCCAAGESTHLNWPGFASRFVPGRCQS